MNKIATEYILFKRYEKRVGKGKFPDLITMYLSEALPHIELAKNIDDAMKFDEKEAKQLGYITLLDYKALEVMKNDC